MATKNVDLFKYVKAPQGKHEAKPGKGPAPEAKPVPGLGNFNGEAVRRPAQKATVSLKLSRLEEFEHNPRQVYDEEEMEQLRSSIRTNGEIDQIQVVRIVKGDRYVVADGHRTRRAMIAEFGEDHKTEVIVQKEFQEYGDEAIAHLLKMGIVTSFTKVNLKVWEQLDASVKYLEILGARSPDREWSITQRDVYEPLGISREKAMRLGRILAHIPRKQWKEMKESEISESLLLSAIQVLRSKDDGLKEAVFEEMGAGHVNSPLDVEALGNAWDGAERAVPENVQDRKKVVKDAAVAKFRKEKRAAGRIDPKTDANARAAAEVVKLKKKLQGLVATVDPSRLDDGARQAYTEALVAVRDTADGALKAGAHRKTLLK